MRIIAGKWRSRRIERALSADTRPMPDRVKGSIFNVLGVYFQMPGELPALRVGDLFAGSGSMGLEALSRGARWCTFFERDPRALDALRGNIACLAATDACDVVTTDAWRAAGRVSKGGPFDLIFLDPPYRDSTDTTPEGRVRVFLAELAADPTNRPLVVLHHPAAAVFETQPGDPWRILDQRRIGSNRITMFSR
jgi:16S rRNA (guanine966-N2)-methyltransferase